MGVISPQNEMSKINGAAMTGDLVELERLVRRLCRAFYTGPGGVFDHLWECEDMIDNGAE